MFSFCNRISRYIDIRMVEFINRKLIRIKFYWLNFRVITVIFLSTTRCISFTISAYYQSPILVYVLDKTSVALNDGCIKEQKAWQHYLDHNQIPDVKREAFTQLTIIFTPCACYEVTGTTGPVGTVLCGAAADDLK